MEKFLIVIFYITSHVIFSSMLTNSVSKYSNLRFKKDTSEFPESFKFGVASSAYQIEGAFNRDGKCESIWDKLTHEHSELVVDGSNGDISSNSYDFYMKDVQAIKSVGFDYYRFSISWPRIIINGTIINQKGIDHYNNLINALIANNIQPAVTMFHWDLPVWLHNLGGFANPIIEKYFEFYADVLFKNFGDRVKIWMTFNEPLLFCLSGYGKGSSGPLVEAPGTGEYLCGHHILLSHATAYHLYKNKYFVQQQGEIGIVNNLRFYYAKDESVSKGFVDEILKFTNGWLLNPIFNGGYHKSMIERFDNLSKIEGSWSRLPHMSEEIKKKIHGTADFLGVNYYTSRLVSPKTEKFIKPFLDDDLDVDFSVDKKWTKGHASWFYIVPNGLYDLLLWLRDEFKNPKILITENGFPSDGDLNDIGRISYFKDHLAQISRAIKKNCRVVGYTAWSLIDSFEWLDGYTQKFGIFAVNMTSENKERIPRKSSEFFKEIIVKRKIN